MPSVLSTCIFINQAMEKNELNSKNACLGIIRAIGNSLPIVSPIYRLWTIVKVDERYSSVDTVKSLALREVLGESTLQFITQVSYMMRFGSNGWIQIASVMFSFVSIIRTVADFSIYSITSACTKVKGCMVIVLGTGFKITAWALIFASLRYYAFAMLAISAVAIAPVFCWGLDDGRGLHYLFSIFNFGVQISFFNGLQTALIQWIIIAIHATASLLIPYFCVDIFRGEIPALIDLISPVILLPATLLVMLVVSLVVELLTFKHLENLWGCDQQGPKLAK